MPKVQKDEALLQSIQAIVKECDGYSRTAKRLDVDRVVLWRFCATGCAIERNHTRLVDAVKRYRNESNKTDFDEKLLHFAKNDKVTADDLRVLRNFCQKMISIVDVYEKMNESAALMQPQPHGLSALSDTTVPERGN